jgi:RNA polymerase sigma-70 factor (sigma-E family)
MKRSRDFEISALFDEHFRWLRGLAFVMLGDAAGAEDVAMEAFVRVFSRWPRFRKIEDQRAYLRQVVVNLCRSRWRRAVIEGRVNALVGRQEERHVRPMDRLDESLDLWEAIRRLPERQRACVILYYLEDLSEAQVGELLSCSPGTVKSQLSKARAKLGDALRAARLGGANDE